MINMFTKKKVEDQFEKILYTDDIQLKTIFLKKQIDFFKSQKPNFEYDYKSFLILIEEFQTSKIFENNLIWLQVINEIIRLNPNMKKKYFKLAMKIVFSEKNNEIDEDNNEKKEEANNTIINAISVFTDNCEKIFEYDSYFQNFNRLKALLQLLIFDLFPHHYNKDNNSVLLLISNIFFNINKNKEKQIFLKNTYFSVMFNLLIEILCYLCLYNSLKIIDMKKKSSFSMIEISNNCEIEDEKKISLNQIDDTKKKYLDLIEKSKKLFDLYLNLGEKNNFGLIINYQMLMKIFIIHCLESQYNESNCIEWFNKFYNNFRINKILKIITDSFDDEIFDLFYINENIFDEESNKIKKRKIITNTKLNFVNNFFYLTENNTKEIELKNSINNFIGKFSKLRKKLNENKEYLYNGLFILINLLFNEILSKKELTIDFQEEFIIITLFKSVMKYMIKTSVIEMLEDNINNIDNLLNLIIGRFGVSLGENIWKEIMVLIKYFYSELSRKDEEYSIKNLSILLKKIILLKINGNYQSYESIFYDLLNKVCESKKNSCIINDYILFSVYFKNKFKSLKSLDKNLSSLGLYFINLIKDNYNLFEKEKSVLLQKGNNNQGKNSSNLNSEKVIEVFANYILIYLNAYSKYENKNIELFLYKNLNYLNFYFGIKKYFRSQYINLFINVLNNTSDLNYFKKIVNNLSALHVSEIQVPKSEEFVEKSLNLFKKLIIKLINKLSISYQIKKLNYLFESIHNRLNDNLNNNIDYDFLKNIIEIFNFINVTKYNELLIYNKIKSKKKANDIVTKNYFSIGKNLYSSLLVEDEKKLPKKAEEEWCFIDIKGILDTLIELLKNQNINIELKEQILNFIRNKINDIFFFNKINIEAFLDYVIGLDKENLKEFILYSDKINAILSINDILKNIVYLLLYNKRLFRIKNREEIYDKIITYVFEKINYSKKIIRLIINKYNLKVIKNRNSKHLILMKNLLGIDNEGMPNILNLKLEPSDFKFTNKDREKDINYQIFIDEGIQIDTFSYPKNNLKEILNYFQSYIDILEISLNSLIYIHIKNININNNTPFVKQLEKNVKICFDKNNKNENSENTEPAKNKNDTIPDEIKNKYEKICQKFFGIFNKFPDIIKFQRNFLYDIYKLFLYCYDFIIFFGEKYIIKAILILFSISFPEFYQKFYDHLNKEFKFKYNNGKDFPIQKIESIQLIENLPSEKEDNKSKRINSIHTEKSLSFLENFMEYNNYEKSNSEMVFHELNKLDKNDVNSKSVFDLHKEKEKESNEKVDRIKSSEECFYIGLNNDNDNVNEIKDKKEQAKTKNEKIINQIFLIRKILIEFIIKSKYSLKIFHIINNIIKESNKNNEEGIILFLLLCKWKIINEQNLDRNEDINIFKNRSKIKNYFNRDIYNISIENLNQKKTVAIKSPISSFNYIINNNYKNAQNKDTLKILTQSLVQEKERKNVEEILYQKLGGENNQIFNQYKKNFNKDNSNNFCYKSSSNVLNEIKELEDEENINLSKSGEKSNKDESGEENNYSNEDVNAPNLEELISIMHKKTKNNLFKMFENELNKVSIKFNNIDKSLLYNELSIIVSYVMNSSKKSSLFNLYNSNFIKFLKKLTKKEDGNNLPSTQIKLNEQKEFIYSDNFNITKYILNSIETSSDMINSYIYLIFNDTLQNKSSKTESLIKNNLDLFNEYIYLYIFIIPISEEFWKIEFRLNKKKNDEFSKKLKIMIEKNFFKCYFFSIKNNFGYIIYHLKILFSLLQDLVCNIKNGLTDRKLRNKLNGIKHEEMIERMHLFKSIDDSEFVYI